MKDNNIIEFQVVKEKVKEKESQEESKDIIEHLETQIEILKNNPTAARSIKKAFLVVCHGDDDSDDWDYFQYAAYGISPKDFIYLSEKIKFQYITN